jgi:hypothetical protein
MPGADLDEDDGNKASRQSRLMDKLKSKYTEANSGNKAPEMTEEEKFWQFKEN